MSENNKIIIGISGASGIIYGIRLLEVLKKLNIETHLVITKSAEQTRDLECELTSQELKKLADVNYSINDMAGAISSGSFKTAGMIVAPCSMKSLAEIAMGLNSNLLTRAADVTLKERRKLVLLTRETPLNQIHIENMLKVTKMGGIIAPPVPAFYIKPNNINDLVNHTIARCLDLFGFSVDCKRWT